MSIGTIWWIADDYTEVRSWGVLHKVPEYRLAPREGGIDVLLSMPVEDAPRLLGYTPDASEWLEQ